VATHKLWGFTSAMEKVSISDLPRQLRAKGIIVKYNAVWRAACEGRIPAEREGGRLFIKAKDFPAVVAEFTPANQ